MKRRYWIAGRTFTSLLIITAISNISLAEEANADEDQGQIVEDLSRLSTSELEKRSDEAEREIGELEIKAGYLKNEEPVYFDYSPGLAERSGFITQDDDVSSKLLNPMATRDVERRLDRLERLKAAIEEELDKRGE